MKSLKILGLSFLFASCAATTQKEFFQSLQGMEENKAISKDALGASMKPTPLALNEGTSGYLDNEDIVVVLGQAKKVRSYVELFEANATRSEHYVEIWSLPSKPWGVSDWRAIYPAIIVYNSKFQ
jgi:hypothetical protein